MRSVQTSQNSHSNFLFPFVWWHCQTSQTNSSKDMTSSSNHAKMKGWYLENCKLIKCHARNTYTWSVLLCNYCMWVHCIPKQHFCHHSLCYEDTKLHYVEIAVLGVDYTCVLDVQFGCTFHRRMRFRCQFWVFKPENYIENACDGETHIQTAHPKRKCDRPLKKIWRFIGHFQLLFFCMLQ
jgi:hypothetical protein